MSNRDLTEIDQDKIHAVRIGESVSIRLPEIGGTAFLWHLTHPTEFEFVEDHVELNDPIPGGAATRHLVFEPSDVGYLELILHRYRPWESATEADSSVTFRFEVGNETNEAASS